MIKVGDEFPEATLYESTQFGDACPMPPQAVKARAALAGKRVVIFGLPGAFTTTCSAKHLPGYVEQHQALRDKGIDEVWCVSVNDGWVMAAWGQQHAATDKVRMLGDAEAELTNKLGLGVTIPGMGVRMQRCSMLVESGIVTRFHLEEPRAFAVSSVEHMLQQLG